MGGKRSKPKLVSRHSLQSKAHRSRPLPPPPSLKRKVCNKKPSNPSKHNFDSKESSSSSTLENKSKEKKTKSDSSNNVRSRNDNLQYDKEEELKRKKRKQIKQEGLTPKSRRNPKRTKSVSSYNSIVGQSKDIQSTSTGGHLSQSCVDHNEEGDRRKKDGRKEKQRRNAPTSYEDEYHETRYKRPHKHVRRQHEEESRNESRYRYYDEDVDKVIVQGRVDSPEIKVASTTITISSSTKKKEKIRKYRSDNGGDLKKSKMSDRAQISSENKATLPVGARYKEKTRKYRDNIGTHKFDRRSKSTHLREETLAREKAKKRNDMERKLKPSTKYREPDACDSKESRVKKKGKQAKKKEDSAKSSFTMLFCCLFPKQKTMKERRSNRQKTSLDQHQSANLKRNNTKRKKRFKEESGDSVDRTSKENPRMKNEEPLDNKKNKRRAKQRDESSPSSHKDHVKNMDKRQSQIDPDTKALKIQRGKPKKTTSGMSNDTRIEKKKKTKAKNDYVDARASHSPYPSPISRPKTGSSDDHQCDNKKLSSYKKIHRKVMKHEKVASNIPGSALGLAVLSEIKKDNTSKLSSPTSDQTWSHTGSDEDVRNPPKDHAKVSSSNNHPKAISNSKHKNVSGDNCRKKQRPLKLSVEIKTGKERKMRSEEIGAEKHKPPNLLLQNEEGISAMISKEKSPNLLSQIKEGTELKKAPSDMSSKQKPPNLLSQIIEGTQLKKAPFDMRSQEKQPDLLSQIKEGKDLKKAPLKSNASRVNDGPMTLLSQIKLGSQLRRVSQRDLGDPKSSNKDNNGKSYISEYLRSS